MSRQRKQIEQAALMGVFCNTMMLTVCDDLVHTTLYKTDRKQRINALAKDLERFMSTFYLGMNDEQEKQYILLIRTVEAAAKLITQTPVHDAARLAAFLDAWQKGQFAEVQEEQYQGLVKCGMLTPAEAKQVA